MSIAFTDRGRRAATAAGVLTAALILVAACSSSPSSSEPSTAPSAAPSTAPASVEPSAPASEGGAQSGDITVTIAGRSFGSDLTITAGSSVTFVNQDAVPHTVTNGKDGTPEANPLFDESLDAGATGEAIVFDTPGTFTVTCKIHRTMNLTITVE